MEHCLSPDHLPPYDGVRPWSPALRASQLLGNEHGQGRKGRVFSFSLASGVG